MAAFAAIPLDDDIEVQPLDRELNLFTQRVEKLYRRRRTGEEFPVHFETISWYRADGLDRQGDHVRAITPKYKLPCRSYFVT